MISEIRRSDIGGVPVLSHPSVGSRIAGLVFRTGRAAESLHTSGITHLVEHLALGRIAGATYSYNGFVDLLRTSFVVTGSDDEIVDFFSKVCAALNQLPEDRIDKERTVLLTEEAGAPGGPLTELYAARFGARGFGLPGFKQLGLLRVTAQDVTDWAQTRFSRENAILWVSGEAPDGLELDLQDGRPASMPQPTASPTLQVARYIPAPTDSLTLTALVRRSAAMRAAQSIAVRRLQQTLRDERAITYNVAGTYDPLDAGVAHLSISADSLEEHSADVSDSLLRTLHALQSDGATGKELEDDLERLKTEIARPEATPGLLDGIASSELFGWEASLPDQVIREAVDVAPDDVSAAAGEILESILMLGPEGARPPSLPLIEDATDTPVPGRTYRARHRLPWKKGPEVVVADHGISVIKDGCVTIEFADVEALIQHSEGLHLVGTAGETISLKPHLLARGGELMSKLQAAIPRERFIPLEPSAEGYTKVEMAAERDLPRRWVVVDELSLLRDLVDPSEDIQVLAEASSRMRAGLLALTERRLIFIYAGMRSSTEPKVVEMKRERVTVTKVTGAKIELEAEGVSIKLDEVTPPERLGQIASALGEKPPRTLLNDAAITLLFALLGFGMAVEGSRWTAVVFCLVGFIRAWLGSGMGANVMPRSRRWMNRAAAAISVIGALIFITRLLIS